MSLQHPLPERQTRSQTEDQSRREKNHPGRKEEFPEDKFLFRSSWWFLGMSRTTFRGPGEDGEEEEESSVEEEESDGTEAAPAPVGASEGSRGPTLAQSDQPTPSMKAPEYSDGTQAFKVRSFIQSHQLIFYNDPANFSQEREKALYATSFLVDRAAKWIEPYLSNLTNQDSCYHLNSWPLFESQLFNLFGDPNEVTKAEAELDGLRMKEGGHVALYIADIRSLVSRIGDWGERALIHHFRKGLASRIMDQLASHH
ncbi:hypothetical protein O181_051190 [Austropuccinia psidii MF-1]|uniref:Retrotransposon gag domain-containing protein n=1 Tax=Austropuccinia psidii MF-1 TaxID=1389203 RepID=A0A9Q3E2J9_9BASI|nr:hypothetical protein [Austropuccinia psidii MF-1]